MTDSTLCAITSQGRFRNSRTDSAYGVHSQCHKSGGSSASRRHTAARNALLACVEEGELSYDHRQRGTEVESDREAALDVIRRQERELLAFPTHSERPPLRLSAIVSSSLPATEVESTVGRELAFVLSHTVHHNALIAVMARTLDVPVPDRFGYAPSTIAHLEKAACAR